MEKEMKKLFVFLSVSILICLFLADNAKADYIRLDSLWQMNFDTTVVGTAKFSHNGNYIGLTLYLDSDHQSDSIILKPALIYRATGQVIREFSGMNSKDINSLDFSPDDSLIVAAGDDSMMVCIWNVSTGNLLRTIYFNDSIFQDIHFVDQIIFSPNGQKLFIRIYGQREIELPGYPPHFEDINMLVVYNTQTWQVDRYVNNVESKIKISPDNKYYAPIHLGQRSVDLYDFNNDTLVHTFVQKDDSSYTISTFDFSPDSNNIAISDVYDIRIYDLNNYAQVDSISFLDSIHPPHQIMPIKYFPNSKYLFLNNLSGIYTIPLMKIFDFQTRQFIYQDSSGLSKVDISRDSLYFLKVDSQILILDSIIYVQYKRVVDNEDGANKFNISPNPVTDYLNINIQPSIKPQKIEIYTALGIKLIETEYKERIDVSGLMPGVYFVKRGDKVGKFVKI